jgi:hypothetical protein
MAYLPHLSHSPEDNLELWLLTSSFICAPPAYQSHLKPAYLALPGFITGELLREMGPKDNTGSSNSSPTSTNDSVGSDFSLHSLSF